ncbi:hypothetical protein CASFOL_039858 [Castilleja foliolosa]|uniref:Zinc-finger domain-containing protein n=1 Tax=Castilleja foliolosa TaxID=1961234 RepID=A0ABD3BGE6_9LAMI
MVTLGNTHTESINSYGEKHQHKKTAKEDFFTPKISDYELSREERIKENKERLQKLGIFDLSLKLNAFSRPTPKRSYQKKNLQFQSPLQPSGPVRRSSRLQSSTPVSYCEVEVVKNKNSLNDDDFRREVGSKPEVYTDEHEKLLGSTEKSWTLFVDGYGKDGKRIYDSVQGKTCHQCRQKTLGHRTHCSTCSLVQGQFCGDCLYMRYGENVLEANENPNWVCPVCRGICNCSLCRQAKGWPPTGTLYRKISSLGYKSVAHYLIQTRRSDIDSDTNASTAVPGSAKRSLPFSDIDDLSKSGSEHLNTDPISQPEPEKNKEANILVDRELEVNNISLETVTETKTTIETLNDNDKSPKSNKKRVHYESTQDSIGGRLRQRRNPLNNDSDVGPVNEKKDIAENGKSSEKRAQADSIASRLRTRQRI